MTEVIAYARWYGTWLWLWARDCVRDIWRDLPGPVWLKVIIMTTLFVAFIIPGQIDEIIVLLIIKFIIRVTQWVKTRH